MDNWQILSAAIVAISGMYYAVLAWHRKIYPNPVSWSIWAVVGWGLLLTSDSANVTAVFMAALFGAVNPTAITGIILLREREKVFSLSKREKQCLKLAACGYVLWFLFKDYPAVAPWSLYWMIGVDLFAVWPTIEQIWKDPMSDKPFAWSVFAFGYGISGFAITEHTVVNWALPAYMFIGGNIIALPMVVYRIRCGQPMRSYY